MTKLVSLVLVIILLAGCTPSQPEMLAISHSVYIPIVSSPQDTIVGVEAESSLCKGWYREGTNIRVSVRWSEAEKFRGEYDWSKLENKLCGYRPTIITIKTTPEWARAPGEPLCKLPLKKFYPDLERFIKAVDKEFNPVYIELWNEPDATYEFMPKGHEWHYGCVGAANGDEYGEFVSDIYKAVRSDIQAEIIIGAVASATSRFLYDAVLEAENNFDALSFHCYATSWEKSGLYNGCIGALESAKTYTDKEVILSETAVLRKSGSKEQFETAQVEFFKWSRVQVVKFFWYTVNWNGWPVCEEFVCNSDLVYREDKIIKPRPVWYLYYYE